jgi:hypothetical protein
MSLPYSSSSPADSREKKGECLEAGGFMKILLEKDIKPRDIMTKAAFENAIRMVMITGGSTNAVLHLIAMSRSCQDPDVAIALQDFQRISNIVSLDRCCFLTFSQSTLPVAQCVRLYVDSFPSRFKAFWKICHGRCPRHRRYSRTYQVFD